MDTRFRHPWFGVLADIKKKAREAGMADAEIIELPHLIIHEVKEKINPHGGNMLNLSKKDMPAVREIAERVLANYLG